MRGSEREIFRREEPKVTQIERDLAKRNFHVLDALRGVAALVVMPRHTDKLFWSQTLLAAILR